VQALQPALMSLLAQFLRSFTATLRSLTLVATLLASIRASDAVMMHTNATKQEREKAMHRGSNKEKACINAQHLLISTNLAHVVSHRICWYYLQAFFKLTIQYKL